MNNDSAIIAALTAIEARLDRIEQQLASIEQQLCPLSPEDRRRVDLILPHLTDKVFTVKDLRDEAVGTANVDLAAALDSIGSTKSFGRLLSRAADAHYGVRRVSSKQPTVWQRLF